jgi:hypothetical protein
MTVVPVTSACIGLEADVLMNTCSSRPFLSMKVPEQS